jgi:hypothetical protein
MPTAQFEPKIPARGQPQTHALDRATSGIGRTQDFVFDNGALVDLTTAVDTGAVNITTASWSAICNASLL